MLANFPPTLRIDFLGATALDPRITFTRPGSANYFDSSGVLQTATTDAPRFEYISALGRTALLVERGRVNICLWNRDLTNVAWTPTNITPALDQTGIDGASNSASSITATGANGTILQNRVTASAARIFGAHVKRITGSGGVDMTIDNGATWTPITLTGSWARQRIPIQTLANPTHGFRIQTSGDAIAVDYCQNEAASSGNYLTSPILTTTANVTRPLDLAAILSLGSWFNPLEGTFRVSIYDPHGSATQARPMLNVCDGTLNERISLAFTNSFNHQLSILDGGAVQCNIQPAAGAAGVNRMAASYKVNSIQGAGNGAVSALDTVGTMPTVDRVHIGADADATSNGDLLVLDLTYWPRIRSANALKAMSSI